MSMPQPIFVALVGEETSKVSRSTRSFRLSAPGIGGAYYCALDAGSEGRIVHPQSLRPGLVTLWICLDRSSLEACEALNARDRTLPGYGRGFYDEIFPEACVLVPDHGTVHQKNLLQDWAKKIIDAWYSTG
jgi:hypothetical protein